MIANELAAAMNAYIDDYAFDPIDGIYCRESVKRNSILRLTAAIVNKMEEDALAAGANLAGAHTL